MTPILTSARNGVSKEWGLFFVKPKAALWAASFGT
jgi:hypothetical protein